MLPGLSLLQGLELETMVLTVQKQSLDEMLAGGQTEDPRIRAMRQAWTPNPEDPDGAGQEEADWDDVVQYFRGVGGNALRFMGVPQKEVRNLGLV